MQADCVVREHYCSEAADVLNAMMQALQSLRRAWSQSKNLQLLITTLLISKYCAFIMSCSSAGQNICALKTDCCSVLQLSTALRQKQGLLVTL